MSRSFAARPPGPPTAATGAGPGPVPLELGRARVLTANPWRLEPTLRGDLQYGWWCLPQDARHPRSEDRRAGRERLAHFKLSTLVPSARRRRDAAGRLRLSRLGSAQAEPG